MHPTRRKLVDMVKTGEYQKDSQISVPSTKQKTNRKVGEVWEENGVIWEQKSYGTIKQSKGSNELSKVRKYLEKAASCKSETCSKNTYGVTDKKLITKTGYCSQCLAEKEAVIKRDGLWQAYTEYKMYSNMATYGTEVLEKWNQALNDVSNVHKFINEDGSVESWVENVDVDYLREELEKDIKNGKKELTEVIEKRNEAYTLLKDKNYDLVQSI